MAIRSIFSAALSLLIVAGMATAQERGTPESAPCRQALESLQARERAAASAPSSDARAGLEAARRQAAVVCLGGPSDPAASAAARRAAQPAAAPVPRITIPQVAAPNASRSMLPTVPRPAPPPVMVTGCDAHGCWASDGTRLQRAGPNLIGPRGVCTSQGGVLVCP